MAKISIRKSQMDWVEKRLGGLCACYDANWRDVLIAPYDFISMPHSEVSAIQNYTAGILINDRQAVDLSLQYMRTHSMRCYLWCQELAREDVYDQPEYQG